MNAERESRHGPYLAAQSLTGANRSTDAILPGTTADAAVFFRDAYAVLVRGRSVRRHLYFNLPAAQRTVRRAIERGDRAEMILVKLVPVDARHLDREVDE